VNKSDSHAGPLSSGPADNTVISILIKTGTIRLSQLLKLANVVQDGAEAKFRITNEEVRVNGIVEIRRGRKLQDGDRVKFGGESYEVVAAKADD
jgi:ribosome-associated protein